MQIMSNEALDLEARLYVIANIADKISGFYHRNCDGIANDKLKLTLLELSQPDVARKKDRYIYKRL